MKKRTITSLAFVVLLSLPLLLFYQNCSVNKLVGSEGLAVFKSYGGNGDPYDGKIDAFARLVPGITCDDKLPAIGKLNLSNSSAQVIPIESACNPQVTAIDILRTDLVLSKYTNKYVGYKNTVYTNYEKIGQAIDLEQFTEAWCTQSETAVDKKEIAVEVSLSQMLPEVSIYDQARPQGVKYTAVRSLGVDQVTYEFKEFILVVSLNLDRKSLDIPKAHVLDKYTRQIKDEYNCRMGGRFDPVAPKIEFSGASQVLLASGQTMAPLKAFVNKPILQFSIQPELPNGLKLDQASGEIAGTPTQEMAYQSFTVKAKLLFGEVAETIRLGVGRPFIVTQDGLNLNSSCTGELNSQCSLKDGFALAHRIMPIPVVMLLNLPLFKIGGSALSIPYNLGLWGNLNGPTTFDAESLSSHLNVTGNGSLVIRRLKFINGKSVQDGGSLKIAGGPTVVEDSVFENNSAVSGGAISFISGNLQIFSSQFLRNYATSSSIGDGGAIQTAGLMIGGRDQQIPVMINNCLFVGNKAAHDGGAISHDGRGSGKTLVVKRSIFLENESVGQGGAIVIVNDKSLVKETKMANNKSKRGGALFYRWAAGSVIEDSEFESNVATTADGHSVVWFGSDIFGFKDQYGSALRISKSVFKNTATPYSDGTTLFNGYGRLGLESTFLEASLSPAKSCARRTCEFSPADLTLDTMNSCLYNSARTYTDLGGNSIFDQNCF